ncbi:hypothetical protein CCH79_00001556 [Gambusia affinis]|uniref:Ras-related protein Rab-23 n=1 Tax=Gambusia affinis TaxID=33528 RepID=A0A315VSL8_GAMAF|nr:hypothetical protein CCH79_00001556 [Gambusia affinis]
MLEEDMEVAIKVVVVGNGAVGKSSMIQRYCKGIFTKDYKKTIGVDFLERQIIVNGEEVRLMLWDTAGQEEFDAITKAYYRGAQACVLVFSTTDRESYQAIDNWREKVEAEVGNIPTVLVQNKIDLLEETVIKNEEAEALAKRLKLRFYRASVKEDLNVNEVFKYLAEKYLQRLKQQTAEETEVIHSTSNKIGVFNTTNSNVTNQSSSNGREVITLRPNKQRTKKNVAFCSASSCWGFLIVPIEISTDSVRPIRRRRLNNFRLIHAVVVLTVKIPVVIHELVLGVKLHAVAQATEVGTLYLPAVLIHAVSPHGGFFEELLWTVSTDESLEAVTAQIGAVFEDSRF